MPHTIHPARPVTPGVYTGTIQDVAVRPLHRLRRPDNPDGIALRVCVRFTADDGEADCYDAIAVTTSAVLSFASGLIPAILRLRGR